MTAALATSDAAPAPRRIFNHDIMGCTAEGVIGNHLYSGRALGLTKPGDIIQLHPDLEPQWPFIHEHYLRAGLSHTKDLIWHVGHQGLREHRGHAVSVFYFGRCEQEARPDGAWYRAVDFINSKNNFMALADVLYVPVPRTRCFSEAAAICDRHIETFPFPCYLKAAVSVSGVGIYRCADAAELRTAMREFTPRVPVQLQQEVVSDSFLNLQYEVTAAGLRRLAATEQVLDGFVHQGNRHPVAHEPWECVDPMAEWLFTEGIKGVFAFDVAVIEGDKGIEYQAIECNPRFNGASYPTAVAHKLGVRHWLARSFATRHRSLADLDLIGIEYDARRGDGVVLVNWGPVLVGKLLFLIAGPPHTQERLTLELQKRL
jgi:hypothetical protein